MRHSNSPQFPSRPLLAAGLAVLLLAGCADPGQKGLAEGYQALERRDYERAAAAADGYLAKTPRGPGAAEALYLRGRAFQARTATSDAVADANLAEARRAYVQALILKPPQSVEANLRADLANVAFFQDDYATAIDQWERAIPLLDDPTIKALATYRIGVSLQRLGRFNEADETFRQVMADHPNSEASRLARTKVGHRQFYVQVGAYTTASGAQTAVDTLRGMGLTAVRTTDDQGRTLVRVGPARTYAEALGLDQRLSSRYPDALIVP